MDDCAQGFRIGDTLHPWGTRFQALVPDATGDGYVNHEIACTGAYGFETIYVELTSAGADRPVTSAAYELASVLTPKDAFARLVVKLGQPGKVEREEEAAGDPGRVALYAYWRRDGYTLSVSLYGATRPSDFGDGIGRIYLTWTDTAAAAAPFLAEWKAGNDAVARASATAKPAIFTVRYPIVDRQYPAASASDRALSMPYLFETPAEAAKRLGSHSFALWSDGDGACYLSHGRDTIKLGGPRTSIVQVLDIAPAKGSGFAGIEVGAWSVRDVHRSRAIADAAAALKKVSGIKIERQTGHDV
jgi:hypothetical protein